MPVTSIKLDHVASTQRLGTGIPKLDEMLGGKDFIAGAVF